MSLQKENVLKKNALRSDRLELVVFTVHGIKCALRIDEVMEIKKITAITKVYQAPDYVAGVVNLRGKIVTLIDVQKKLDSGISLVNSESRMVVIMHNDELIGLLVDTIEDTIHTSTKYILDTPSTVAPARAKFFKGVLATSNDLVAILDKSTLLKK